MKTLKSKLTIVYLFLVLMIGAIGIYSVFNFYHLSKSINGLMVDNYKSINAARQMSESIEDQNLALFDYISTWNKLSLNKFYYSSSNFYKWFNIEASNITEKGEKAYVDSIYKNYMQYQTIFPSIQKVKDAPGASSGVKFYNKYMKCYFTNLRNDLKNLTLLNEKAMFGSKNKVTINAKNSMYLLMLLSLLAIFIGFVVATFFTNKFLKPLYTLKEHMKGIKEGYIKQAVPIISNDEIGDLAVEFNNMILRLLKFEKSTKGKLLQEKNRSLAIVKSISDPLIVLDTDYKVLLLNHAAEIFFDVSEIDAIHKHFLEVIRNGDVFDHILKAFGAAEEKYIPNIFPVKVGEKDFYFDTIVTKVRDEENSVTGIVVLFQNITKLKKLEKTKTEFVSTISHEFKTPLTSIMMGTSLIKNKGLGILTDKQQEIIATIEDDTERLSTLVNDIIQLSKAESEKDMFYFEKCSIYDIVENCIKTFSEQVLIKEINIYSSVDKNLPPILADNQKLSWVLNNLISNSIKFTNSGGYIEINAYAQKDTMFVSVKDNGIGISDDYKDKIFEKFVKIYPYNSEIQGTGLGLAIAKEIVETHKGKIWCENNEGKGANFIFTLPIEN